MSDFEDVPLTIERDCEFVDVVTEVPDDPARLKLVEGLTADTVDTVISDIMEVYKGHGERFYSMTYAASLYEPEGRHADDEVAFKRSLIRVKKAWQPMYFLERGLYVEQVLSDGLSDLECVSGLIELYALSDYLKKKEV